MSATSSAVGALAVGAFIAVVLYVFVYTAGYQHGRGDGVRIGQDAVLEALRQSVGLDPCDRKGSDL